MQKSNIGWKVTAGVIGGLVVGGFGAVGYVNDDAQVAELQNQITALENQPVPLTEIVEVEVPVDSENLEVVLNHLYDNEGNVDYLIDDLDDDELDQVIDRVVFINEIKDLAVAELKAEAADELDKVRLDSVINTTYVGNESFDEDEIERVRVQDDDNEVLVTDVDFEDSDADIEVSVKFEQDDIKYIAKFNVEIKDSEIDDIDLVEIRER